MAQRIGRYLVQARIGSGSTGTVYLAMEPDLERRVAIKELAPELAGDAGFMRRFRQEAATMARLDNPNCVKVFDFFDDGGTSYLVCEYVGGASLREVVEQAKKLTPQQALGVLKGALTGLSHAHSLGLVHRDIKPENVLCDRQGTSKLADFGLTTSAGGQQDAPKGGSPLYMSPEQARGEAVDQRSDIYSCGAVLFELLTGRAPYLADTVLAVRRMHAAEPVPDPRKAERRLPAAVAELAMRAMAKDPVDRPQSAEEFLAALEEAARRSYGLGWEADASIAGLTAAAIAAGAAGAGATSAAVAGTQVAGSAAGAAAAADLGPTATGAGAAPTPPGGGAPPPGGKGAPRRGILRSRNSRIAAAVIGVLLLIGAAAGGLALRRQPANPTATTALDPCVVGTWQATQAYFVLHDADLNADNHLTGGQGGLLSIASDGSSFEDQTAAKQFTGSGSGHQYTVLVRGRTASKIATSGDTVSVTPGAKLEGESYVADRDGIQFGGGTPDVAKLSTSGNSVKRTCSGDSMAFIDGPYQTTYKRTSSSPATLTSPTPCTGEKSTADFSVCPAKGGPGAVIQLHSKNSCYPPGQPPISGLQKPSVEFTIYQSPANPNRVSRTDFPLDSSGQWSGSLIIDPAAKVAPGTYLLGGGCFDAGAGTQNGFGIGYGPIDFEITAS